MKCANCDDAALYEYKLVQDKSIFYCGKHLPRFLEGLRKAGNLSVTQHLEDSVDEALAALASDKPKKKSKATKVEEEPIVEEPVVEEPVIEEPPAEEPPAEEINESNS